MGQQTKPIVYLLSGVNLGLLGEREPTVYGSVTLAEHAAAAEDEAATAGITLEHFQSDHEGDLVALVHRAREQADAIIINPGAFSHYAWALHDALAAFAGPVIELHLSNPESREPWRHQSVVSPVATGIVAGLGGFGYRLAVRAVAELLNKPR
jgi:3-dehydroquinate dehydratase II